jgi:uncharacterized phosphosugar-binding protein
MKIKNEKQLQKLLDSKIEIPVYYSENIDNSRVYLDLEWMRDEFETKLLELEKAILDY